VYIDAAKEIEFQAYQESGGALVDISKAGVTTSMSIHLLSV